MLLTPRLGAFAWLASPKLSPSCFRDTRHRTRHAGRHGQEMVGGNRIGIMSSRHGPSLLQPLDVHVPSVITPVHSHSPPSGSQLHEVLEHVHLHQLTTSTFFTLLLKMPRLLESDPNYLPRLLRLAAGLGGSGTAANKLGLRGGLGKPMPSAWTSHRPKQGPIRKQRFIIRLRGCSWFCLRARRG